MQPTKSVYKEAASTTLEWAVILVVFISVYEGIFWLASKCVHLLGFEAATWKSYVALATIFTVIVCPFEFFYHRNRLKREQARRARREANVVVGGQYR